MANKESEWLTCKLTKARLSAIEDIVRSSVETPTHNFNEIVLHTLKMGGKKLRPSLYLLSLNTGNYYESELLLPAAALELIHIASLHHDDVIDQAETRRTTSSVNTKWGNSNAVFSGNYLFSRAIEILSTFNDGVNLATCQYVSKLCLGQLKEAENAYNLNINHQNHIEIVKCKTASLFELPCKLGGILSDAKNDEVDKMVSFAENLGIAFQLVDDILDLNGDSAKTGKKLGTDLKEGVYTYATITALQAENSSGELSDLLLIDDLKDTHIQHAIKLIKERGGLEAAVQKAQVYIDNALDSISFLPENETKRSFINLTKFILLRNH